VTLTADGCQITAEQEQTNCCAPPLCGNNLCCTFVAFMRLLPSGPLWDYWKAQAISYFETHDDPAECPLLKDPACPSLVLHSIYTVMRLRHYIHSALWPAVRESHPATAVTTLDYHLERLQWEDCYAQHCRAVLLGDITPYEVIGECGPEYCEPDFPEDLKCALKKGIALSLYRANRGVIKNLCGLNWVIEPLGAELKPYPPIYRNPVEAAQFSPTDKADDIYLSNSNLTVNTSATALYRSVRSLIARNSGLRYFEIKIDKRAAPDSIGLGVAEAAFPLEDQWIGAVKSIGIYDTGWSGYNGNAGFSTRPFSVGEWIGIGINFTVGKFGFRDAQGWHGDPVTGTGLLHSFPPNTAYYAGTSLLNPGDHVTANFGTGAFAYDMPSQFLAWGLGRCDPLCAPNMMLEICHTKDWLEGCGNGDPCETNMPLPKIPASWSRGCDVPAGLPGEIWPGVLAAECIVRSMLPEKCPSIIRRCC
jgi:hypothetical protein